MDLSNVEKPLIDLLFDPKYEERGEVVNFAMDDKYITRLESCKKPSSDWGIEIEMEIKEL